MPIKIRGMNFTDYEIQNILDLIDNKKPIRTNEWENIGRLHKLKFPDKNRTGHAIKRKFMVLYLSKTPSDDPSCPANVRRAKEIYNKIKEKASLGIEDYEEENESSDDGYDDFVEPEAVDVGNHVPENAANPSTNAFIAPKNASPAIRTRQENFKEPAKQNDSKKQRTDEESSMDKFLHYLMIQNQMDKEERREERKRQQEEERVRREEERVRHEEERAQRQQQNNMMQMMMFNLISSNPMMAQAQQQLGLSSPTEANASTLSPMRVLHSAGTNRDPVQLLENEIHASEGKSDKYDEV